MAESRLTELMRIWTAAGDRARVADRELHDAYEAYMSGSGPVPSPDLHRAARELRDAAIEALRAALAEMERSAHR